MERNEMRQAFERYLADGLRERPVLAVSLADRARLADDLVATQQLLGAGTLATLDEWLRRLGGWVNLPAYAATLAAGERRAQLRAQPAAEAPTLSVSPAAMRAIDAIAATLPAAAETPAPVDPWRSDDAKRARKRLVRQARQALVNVKGTDDSWYVRIAKSEAYWLIDTGQFVVAAGEAPARGDCVYLDPMPAGCRE